MSRSIANVQMVRWILFLPIVMLSVIFTSIAITNFISLPDIQFLSYAYDLTVTKGYVSSVLGLITLGSSVLIVRFRPVEG